MILPEGFYIFSAPADPDMIEAARQFVRDNNLTEEDVRLIRSDGMVSVVTKREINI